ncbi:unnamed protein product [Fraxinus pennsylvanica]|uniref:RING-type domain-containing protein n=1 Tax=Fraxinus pennsylvanica TaxID=56036 RepID=A0AAD2EB40_9LAMI|nr:unnamed protein product [Fraxinus pennsylvanica]
MANASSLIPTAVLHDLSHKLYEKRKKAALEGDLIGLAAATVGLASEAAQHLEQIVPPILYSFSDQDSRVRYYACEALYNIAKVVRGNFTVLFNQIFEVLYKLSIDSDPNDIVTEGDQFRFETFKDEEKLGVVAGRIVPIGYTAKERILQPEDGECCMCLCRYEDALAIQALPCTHHFHTSCIVKWLKVKALCPICKYDIHKGKDHE